MGSGLDLKTDNNWGRGLETMNGECDFRGFFSLLQILIIYLFILERVGLLAECKLSACFSG